MPLQLPPLPQLGAQATRAVSRGVNQPTGQPILRPEQEEAILSGGFFGKAMGTLAWLGETLDKPGRAVRGVLSGIGGGKWGGGLMNLVPFSDTLDLTDPDQAVYGRDLLEQYLGAPKNMPGMFNMIGDLSDAKGWEDAAWDVGGFAAEVLLDPLTMLTVGKLTPKGLKVHKGTGEAMVKADDILKAKGQYKEAQAFEAARRSGKSTENLQRIGRNMGLTKSELAMEFGLGERAAVQVSMPWLLRPFHTAPFMSFGKGKWMEDVMKAVTYGKYSPTRYIRGLFSQAGDAGFSGIAQLNRDIGMAQMRHHMDNVGNLSHSINDMSKVLGHSFRDMAAHHQAVGDMRAFNRFSRKAAEQDGGLMKITALREEVDRTFLNMKQADDVSVLAGANPISDWGKAADTFTEKTHDFLKTMRDTYKDTYKMYGELGGSDRELTDGFIGYFTRRMSPGVLNEKAATGDAGKMLAMLFGHTQVGVNQAREKVLRNWPGGSVGLNDISYDPVVTAMKMGDPGLDKKLREALDEISSASGLYDKNTSVADMMLLYGREKHLAPGVDDAIRRGVIPEGSRNHVIDTHVDGGYLKEVLDYFHHQPKVMLTEGLYGRKLIEDFTDWHHQISMSLSTLFSAHHFLHGKNIVRVADEGKAVPGEQNLVSVWNPQLGLHRTGLDKFAEDFAKNNPGLDLTPYIKEGGTDADTWANLADDLVVSPEAVKTLGTYVELAVPNKTDHVLEVFDRMTNMYKGSLTTYFPAFHSRNLAAGVWQAWTDGQLSIAQVLRGVKDGLLHKSGRSRLEYADEIFGSDLLQGHGRMLDVTTGLDPLDAAEPIQGFWGSLLRPYRGLPAEQLAGSKWRMGDPTAQRGVRGFIDPNTGARVVGRKNIPAQMGENMYERVELSLRGGQYDQLRKLGYTPAQARHSVMRTQFNYGELSKFEKSLMRRLIPFYAWSRKNIPYSFAKLFGNPGGRSAQTLRAMTAGGKGEEYTPRFVRGGLAARFGGPEEAANYLKQGGIPLEDIAKLPMPGQDNWWEMLGMVHPLITKPIEQFAGKQFWSGRDLKNKRKRYLHRHVDSIIDASPFSRVASEGWRFFNAEKPWLMRTADAMSGLKFVTQNLPKERAIEIAEAWKEMLRQDPVMRELTIPIIAKHVKESMDPEELARKEALLKTGRQLASYVPELIAQQEAAAAGGRVPVPTR